MNPIGRMFMATHVAVFRATGGRLGSSMGAGKVLLLTTTGNKSGKRRTVPVMAFEHEGQRVVIASAGGAPTHPAWFKNLQANPDVVVEVPGRAYEARAEVASPEVRAKIWPEVVRSFPRFGEYEKKAQGREIPVVILREKAAK